MRGLPSARVSGGVGLMLLAAWAFYASSAPSLGGVSALWSVSKPTFVTVARTGAVLMLLATTPLVKALARAVLDPGCSCSDGSDHVCSACGLSVSARAVRRASRPGSWGIGEALASAGATVVDWLLPVLAFLSLTRGGHVTHVANRLWGSVYGVVSVWLFEVIMRRHASTSARSSILVGVCFWLYVGRTARVSLDASVSDVVLSTLEELRKALVGEREGSGGSVYWPAFVAGTMTVCVALVAVDAVLGWHIRRNHPAQLRHSHASYSRTWLWVPTTLMYIMSWYLFRPATLTSIFICYEQWKRFKQIRTIVPTVVFAAVEVGQVFWEQWGMFRHQTALNMEDKRAVTAHAVRRCPTTAEGFGHVARRNLRLNQFIMLQPGEPAPGTVLLLGHVRPTRSEDTPVAAEPADPRRPEPLSTPPTAEDNTVLIDTVAVDGESAGKERIPCEPNEVRRVVASLMLRNAASDDHLSQHPCIVRQGARIAATYDHPVVGRLVGFNAPALLPKPPTLLDEFVQRVGRLGVGLLLVYTGLSVAVAVMVYQRPLNTALVIELFLVNNVCLPMTLATVLGVVLQCLPYTDATVPGLAMQAKRAVVSFAERAAASDYSVLARAVRKRLARVRERRSALTWADLRSCGRRRKSRPAAATQSANLIRGVHLTDKTGTLTRNVMQLYGSIALKPAPVEAAAAGAGAGAGVCAGVRSPSVVEAGEPPFKFIRNSTVDEEQRWVARLLTAVTTNTPRAPNLVPEEQAYSVGMGTTLVSVHANGASGWQSIEYRCRGDSPDRSPRKLRRLHFGLSSQHKCVSALLLETPPLGHRLSPGCVWVRLVVQGSPGSLQGATGMLAVPVVRMPTLDDAARCLVEAGCGQPAGAQRNWVIGCSEPFQLRMAHAPLSPSRGTGSPSARGTDAVDAPLEGTTLMDLEMLCCALRDGGAVMPEAGGDPGSATPGATDVETDEEEEDDGEDEDGEAMFGDDDDDDPLSPRRRASMRTDSFASGSCLDLSDPGAARDAWIATVAVTPVRYMLLVDLWRDGVLGAPSRVGDRGLAVWMVTGDGIANARAIAGAIGMHPTSVILQRRTDLMSSSAAAAALADDILSACYRHDQARVSSGGKAGSAGSSVTRRSARSGSTTSTASNGRPSAARTSRRLRRVPRTLYFGVEEQRLLVQFPVVLPKDLARRVGAALAAADSSGRPLVHLVAHSSETELKGSLVRLVQRLMHVATTFTGDGKNDVRALEQADVSFAFPTEAPGHGAQQSPAPERGSAARTAAAVSAAEILQHDPEVAAAASTVVSGRFWLTWGQGHTERDSLANWGAVLWTRVYITTVLLLLKQGLTAGVNVSAAASTGMTENRDPYLPVMYQLFNVVSFGVVITSGVFTAVAPRLQQPLLSVTTVAATSAFGYVLGCACFFLVHYVCYAVPALHPWSATLHTSTASLGVAFAALLLASAYQALTRRVEMPAEIRVKSLTTEVGHNGNGSTVITAKVKAE